MARVEHLDDSFGTESTEVESDKRDSLEDGGSSVKMDTFRVRVTKCTRHPVISPTSHAVTASSRHAEAKLFI